ncbi:Histone-lysine N-methyltransferase SUVR4 [Hordeum vulgare]|nr:Histone-lysine N-methyltransferase SUVR4 [Hordeum vulgare]
MLIKHCKTKEMLTCGSDARASIINHDKNPDRRHHAVKDGLEHTVQKTRQASFVELDVSSSTLGEVKVSLKCKFDPSEVYISLDKVFQIVEDKCLRSYKTLPPDSSVFHVPMEDIDEDSLKKVISKLFYDVHRLDSGEQLILRCLKQVVNRLALRT